MKSHSRDGKSDKENEFISAKSPGDGLDDEILRRLLAILEAANRGAPEDLARLWQSMERDVPDEARVRAGHYLWYLLEYRVTQILWRRPSREDLHEITQRAYPKYARLITGDMSVLEDTLCTVFQLAPAERQLKEGRLMVSTSAAAGVLMDNPAAELIAVRPHLAKWYRDLQQLS